MKGTDKQIKWATEIRANVIKTLESALAAAPTNSTPEQAEVISGIKLRIDRLCEDDIYAGDIIEIFRNIRFGENEIENSSKVSAAYRITMPITNGQKRILCK